jgi:predicted short-subunit dehydrogenase-like oxidoreductase (DUF2520 family)
MTRSRRVDRSFYLVGCGNVGLSFAVALQRAGWLLVGASNRSLRGRRRAAKALKISVAALPEFDQERLPRLVLVAVSDDAISKVGTLLARNPVSWNKTVIAHVSGSRPASALGKILGAALGSIHPLIPITGGLAQPRDFSHAAFAIEGQTRAVILLKEIVRDLKGTALVIRGSQKVRYHAAAVMSSNLVVALIAAASREARRAGIPRAERLLADLAVRAANKVCDEGARKALTGPIARGDLSTIAAHQNALSPESRKIYAMLSQQALLLTRMRNGPWRDIGKILAK